MTLYGKVLTTKSISPKVTKREKHQGSQYSFYEILYLKFS